MSKTKISEYDTDPNNNTDINGINIAENCSPANINNAIRQLMSDLKDWQSGADDKYIVPAGTAAAPSVTFNGDTDTGFYRVGANEIGVAVNGASVGSFTSSGWTGSLNGTLAVNKGGTGATTFTSGALLKGAGTSAITTASAADIVGQIGSTAVTNATYATTAGNGGVTSLNGQTGAITNTSVDSIGSVIVAYYAVANTTVTPYFTNTANIGDTVSGSNLRYNVPFPESQVANDFNAVAYASNTTSWTAGGSALSGTWRCIGRPAGQKSSDGEGGYAYAYVTGLWVRVS